MQGIFYLAFFYIFILNIIYLVIIVIKTKFCLYKRRYFFWKTTIDLDLTEKEIKEERKDKMLELISSEEYIPLKKKELSILLDVPKKDMPMFEEIVTELINEGKLIETKKGKAYGS